MGTTDTSDRMRYTQETMNGTARARMRDAKALLGLVPTPRNGLLNPTEVLNQSARLTKRLIEVNVTYVWDLAGAVRKHVTGLAGVVKDEVLTSAKVANDQAGKLEEAVIEQADDPPLLAVREVLQQRDRRISRAQHDHGLAVQRAKPSDIAFFPGAVEHPAAAHEQ